MPYWMNGDVGDQDDAVAVGNRAEYRVSYLRGRRVSDIVQHKLTAGSRVPCLLLRYEEIEVDDAVAASCCKESIGIMTSRSKRVAVKYISLARTAANCH